MKKIIAVCMSIIMFIFIMPVNTEQTVLADTTNEICNDCHEEIYSHDFAQYAATITSECPVCKAEGKILEKQKCFACDGTGKIIESNRYNPKTGKNDDTLIITCIYCNGMGYEYEYVVCPNCKGNCYIKEEVTTTKASPITTMELSRNVQSQNTQNLKQAYIRQRDEIVALNFLVPQVGDRLR